MRSRYLMLALSLFMMSALIVGIPVWAGGQGQIRIEPHAFDPPDPVIVGSPATFNITVVEHTARDPQLLLVTTKVCLDGLGEGGLILVSWDWNPYIPAVGLPAGAFTPIDKGWIPPESDGFGKIYQAKSLRSHLGVEDELIYYAYLDMLVDGNEIAEGDSYNVTITVPSTSPRVLVYAFGVDSKVPPTRPGFVIPEFGIGTIAALGSMVVALLLRKRVSIIK